MKMITGKRMKKSLRLVIILDYNAKSVKYFGGFKPQVAAKPLILKVDFDSALLYAESEKDKAKSDMARLLIRGCPDAKYCTVSLSTVDANSKPVKRTCAGP